jgi:hypothetical protein
MAMLKRVRWLRERKRGNSYWVRPCREEASSDRFLANRETGIVEEYHAFLLSYYLTPATSFTTMQGCGSGSLSGSGFNRVSGSGSGFGIRIQEGKNDPQKWKKLLKFKF